MSVQMTKNVFMFLGQYSRKAFERLGFNVASELSYSEVLDPATGERVFANMSPAHRGVALLTKRILPEKTEEAEGEGWGDGVFKS